VGGKGYKGLPPWFQQQGGDAIGVLLRGIEVIAWRKKGRVYKDYQEKGGILLGEKSGTA